VALDWAKIAAMTSRPWIGRTRIGLLNTMFSASSSLTWAGVGLPDSRSLRKGCIVIPPKLCYLLLKSSKGLPSRPGRRQFTA